MISMKETYENRVACKEAEKAAAQEAALKRILGFNSQCTTRGSTPWGGGLSFDESGAARLANIAGFLRGLTFLEGTGSPMEQLAATVGPSGSELALHLAVSLDDKLSYLANYGGEREFEVEAAGEGREAQVVKVPSYKVLLYDDGTFGGFGILWNRPYSNEQIHQVARGFDEAGYQGKEADGTEIPDGEQRQRWDTALDKANDKLRLRKELEETRLWTPSWVRRKREKAAQLHEEHKTDEYGLYACQHEDCVWHREHRSHLGRRTASCSTASTSMAASCFTAWVTPPFLSRSLRRAVPTGASTHERQRTARLGRQRRRALRPSATQWAVHAGLDSREQRDDRPLHQQRHLGSQAGPSPQVRELK